MRKLLFKDLIYKFCLILVSNIFLLPQYYIRYPGLIDDGYDFFVVRNSSFFSIIKDGLLFDSRTWPLRLAIKKIFYYVVGLDIRLHYFLYSFVLITLIYLVYRVLLKISVNETVARISSFFILLLPSVVENFYRLGTAEHLQVVLLLLAFLFLNKNNYLSILIVFLSCFFKETSIFYLSFFPIYFLLFKKNSKTAMFSFIPMIIYSSILLYKLQYVVNEYTSQVGFDIENLIKVFMYIPYTFLFYFIVIGFAVFIYRKKIGILSLSIVLILPYLFWLMHSYYYHLPLQIFSFILGVKVFSYYLNERKKLLVPLIFFILFFNLSLQSSVPLLHYWHLKALQDSKLVEMILRNDWSDYHVYSTLSGYENMIKISDYFNLWNGIPPIYLYPNASLVERESFSDHKSLNQISASASALYQKDNNIKKIMVKEIGGVDSYREDLCVSSILIEKSCKYTYILNEF